MIAQSALEAMFFEDPLPLLIGLAVAELAALAMWRARRTRAWLAAACAIPVLAGAIGLLAWAVQTDREQIASHLRAVADGVEVGSLAPADRYTDPGCRMTRAGLSAPKSAMLALARRVMLTWPIQSVRFGKIQTLVAGPNATSAFQTTLSLRTGESVAVGWRIQWARRAEGWRVTAVDVTGRSAEALDALP